jgi:predicted PurR-regulated permease PerM
MSWCETILIPAALSSRCSASIWTICLATIGFFVLYRFGEDYFLVPRIIGRAVEVPALVTVVAVLIGGALLGIIGALVAIPFAAALLLLAREILFPRLDRS